jgi:hypothetical protein
MTVWTQDELTKTGRSEEIDIAARRPDGRLRSRVTVWAVPYSDVLYIRSAVNGRDAAWFRGVQETHQGRIWAAGVDKDVTFEDANHNLDDEIDAAYRAKYRRYARRILNSCLTAEARSTTMKVGPRSPSPEFICG